MHPAPKLAEVAAIAARTLEVEAAHIVRVLRAAVFTDALAWKADAPTQDGLYFYHNLSPFSRHKRWLGRVRDGKLYHFYSDGHFGHTPVDDLAKVANNYIWCGPIAEPEDPEAAPPAIQAAATPPSEPPASTPAELKPHRWPKETDHWQHYHCLDCGRSVDLTFPGEVCPGPKPAPKPIRDMTEPERDATFDALGRLIQPALPPDCCYVLAVFDHKSGDFAKISNLNSEAQKIALRTLTEDDGQKTTVTPL